MPFWKLSPTFDVYYYYYYAGFLINSIERWLENSECEKKVLYLLFLGVNRETWLSFKFMYYTCIVSELAVSLCDISAADNS